MSARIIASALAATTMAFATAAQEAGLQQTVTFDDLAPAGMVLEQCWNATGMDASGKVYIGFTSRRGDGREDFALFRYDPASGERRLLGTFMEASAAVGNLADGEEIPKGHTRLVERDGKIYMGSQGFHDFKDRLDGLDRYRGSHLYAYDIASGVLQDLSRGLPGGVVTRHTGIIALAAVPGEHLLAGLEHPTSNIVLFDPAGGRVRATVPGIPWKLGNPLSREIVATKYGAIYTYRGTEDPAERDQSHKVWVYDVRTGAQRPTANVVTGGFWNGQAATRNGETIYLSTVNGELNRLATASGAMTYLGPFLPAAEVAAGERIDQLYGITLSADERRIYAAPRRHRARDSMLYAHEVATGTVSTVGTLERAIYSGSQVRDAQGRLFMARFGNGDDEIGRAHV